jgi:putative aldouronate transport system permease protein
MVPKTTTLGGDRVFSLIRSNIKKRPLLYVMILPGIIWFAIFCYYPIYGILMAFQNTDFGVGILRSQWVGLKHFIDFFSGYYAWRVIKNTLLINVYSMLWGFPMPIIFALLLNELHNGKFKRIVQTISYMPYFISTVVIVGIIVSMVSLRGTFNQLLISFGMQPILFLQEPGWFRTIYITSGIWQGLGWSSIIYLASIAGVNLELYESAVIDGATRFQRIWHITIPSIMPTINILLILNISSLMTSGFEKVYLLYNSAVYETADVIATYIYREGLVSMNYSYATAVGVFQSVTNLILLVTANSLSRKYTENSIW